MEKPKFLFLNQSGDFLSLAMRVQKEGCESFSWYSSDLLKGKGKAGKNLIPLVDDFFDVIEDFKEHKGDLIIMIDDNAKGDMCDYLRYEGWFVIGSSHFADKAEHDREFGTKLAKKIGLEIPPTYPFTDFPAGERFLMGFAKKYPDASFVFKADGMDLAGSSKTYVSKGIEDLLWFMNWVDKDREEHNYEVDKFELQLKIEGIEADFSSWWNGEQFVNNVNLDLEEKKFEGLGDAQGCLGQVISFEPAVKTKFFRDYLGNLAPILKQTGEINEWAANTIISEKNNKPYFLEWTPRFGWDSTMGELAILQDGGRKISEFFKTIVEHKPFANGFFPKGKYSCGVRLYSESTGKSGKDVCGKPLNIDPSIEDNLWFYSIKKSDEGNYEITDNPIGVAVAVADSVEEAISKVYHVIDPENKLLSTPDLFYSKTIGKRAVEECRKLGELGWW
jgi:phosphoribosylamine-glycine ligase